ncbi:SAM-dependent methyltransferase [Dactylosporangium sp. NPDC049525]|uniref:class I SAM-dependent methyltransferase n=1 Tax=Dactylosporangium sp. NPDC049525 TaxID=3154730 RepID=UPI003448D5E8
MTVGSAFWIAAVRARETERPDRLFADAFARELAGPRGFAIMAASEQASGGENSFIPVRVRWFDDFTMAAVTAGVRQVVLLGAGLDTRAYRLDLPADVDWYELDRREVLAGKDITLAGHAPRCRRHVVVGDVCGDWVTPLLDAGFDRHGRTLWLAEGLFFYLTEQMIVEMLRSAAQGCGAGSLLGADVIGTAGLDSPAMRPYRDWCRQNSVPPPFGSDDPEALLVSGGWQLDHITAPGAPDANYDRLPAQPDGLMPGRTHLVTASLPGL